MIKKITLTLFLLALLTSCVEVSKETATPVPFATATLSATEAPTQTAPAASPTTDPASLIPACKDGAVLVADVTYPDNTHVTAEEKFTKTWKFQNTGDCPWTGYTVAFVSGDRMEAPDAVPVPETKPRASVDVSVDLIAPAADGPYTANFELRNAARQVCSGRDRADLLGEDHCRRRRRPVGRRAAHWQL